MASPRCRCISVVFKTTQVPRLATVANALISNATLNKITSVPTGTNLLYTIFTTATIPAAPTLSSPTNGATGVSTSPTLTWNTSSGATSYRLQVSTSSAFQPYN